MLSPFVRLTRALAALRRAATGTGTVTVRCEHLRELLAEHDRLSAIEAAVLVWTKVDITDDDAWHAALAAIGNAVDQPAPIMMTGAEFIEATNATPDVFADLDAVHEDIGAGSPRSAAESEATGAGWRRET